VNAVVELHDRIVRPKFLLDLLPRHQIPGTFNQQAQDLEGLFLQAPHLSIPTQLTSLQIEFEGTDPEAIWARHFHLG
jgi:hypothetical protein